MLKKFLIAGVLLFSLTMFAPASFKVEVLKTPVAVADNHCSPGQVVVLGPGSAYGFGYGHIVASCYWTGYGHGWHWTQPYWVPW